MIQQQLLKGFDREPRPCEIQADRTWDGVELALGFFRLRKYNTFAFAFSAQSSANQTQECLLQSWRLLGTGKDSSGIRERDPVAKNTGDAGGRRMSLMESWTSGRDPRTASACTRMCIARKDDLLLNAYG